jgi:plasmid stabilization system protein ParE
MNAPRRYPLAKADIEAAARWYEAQQPGLGVDFVDEVQRILGVIAAQPLRYSIRFGNWRRANLRRFPHAVFYQVLNNQPAVFAVLHARRNHGPILAGRQLPA